MESAPMSPTTETIAFSVIDLGANNKGAFGPTPETNTAALYEDAADTKYHKPVSSTWICVDGRGTEVMNENDETADPQIPGSKPVTNTAADMMNPDLKDLDRKNRIAKNTKDDVNRGYTVVLHGDEHKAEAGCAAMASMRDVLSYNAENIDIVAPTVWGLSQAYGLDKHGVTAESVTESIVVGGERATDDSLWQHSPKELVDAAVEAGAEYRTCQGAHTERKVGIEQDPALAYDNRQFAQDHIDANGVEQESFGVALGAYVHQTFADRIKDGEAPIDTANHIARAIGYVVGLTKVITNEAMRVELFGEATPVRLPQN